MVENVILLDDIVDVVFGRLVEDQDLPLRSRSLAPGWAYVSESRGIRTDVASSNISNLFYNHCVPSD